MANAQFENIVSIKKVTFPTVTHAQTIKIAVKENVEKVLNCGADSFVNSYECMTGEVSVFGRSNVRILYCDQQGQVFSANYNADYTERVIGEVTSQQSICFDVTVADCSYEVSGNVIVVNLLLEIVGTTFQECSQPVLVGGEEMFVKYNDVELLQNAHCCNVSCDIVEELTATTTINRILSAESQLCVNSAKVDGQTLVVEGDGTLVLVYITDNDKLVCDRLPFNFSQEKDAKGMDISGELQVSAKVKNTRLRLDVEDDVVNSTFTAEMAVQLTVTSTQQNTVSVVQDAYCTNSDLTLTTKGVPTTLFCGTMQTKRQVEYTLTSTRGKSVACINWRANVTNTSCIQDACQVEGVVSGDIMFSTDEGLTSTHVEIPFAELIEWQSVTSGYTLCALPVVSEVKANGTGNVDICVTICWTLIAMQEVTNCFITDVVEHKLDTQKRCAVEVCIAKKGDTLWQLAKSLHMAEEDITTVNPDLTSPLQQDTKVVIYNKL